MSEPAIMRWDDTLTLFVDLMDRDHAETVGKVNGLYAAMIELEQGTGRLAAVEALWRDFLDHNRRHFAAEEALMRDAADPGLAVHAADHQRFLARVGDCIALLDRGQVKSCRRILASQLPVWLLVHINMMDRTAAAFLTAPPQPALCAP